MTLPHGGNVYEIAARLGCSPDDLLDYSASINPLGPPPGLLERIGETFHLLQHYPDISNSTLVESLAAFHDLPAACIAPGNGSTEIIYCLPRALGIKNAAVVLPTFSEYRKAFEIQGVRMHTLPADADSGFQPTVPQLDALCVAHSPQAILFTHPGSPSGTLLSESVREWIKTRSEKGGPCCIVDEVFIDFCEEESLKRHLQSCPGLVLIRSMTKFYGIPGLRLGYLMAHEETASKVRFLLPPWSVNTVAQIAGVFCIAQNAYREQTLRLVNEERERLQGRLEAVGGMKVLPGKANYLLVELDKCLPPAVRLQQDLLASDRIMVRDCSSFEGLGDHFFRAAVRLPHQNQRLIEGITRWIRSHESA